MKKLILLVVCGLVLGGCGEVTKTQAAPISEADPIKRGAIAMDAIYASETAFMRQGMPAIHTIVRDLQTALAMWPQTGNGEGVDACRIALRLQTTRMLNVMDRLNARDDPRSSDFRQACRDAVAYQYGASRAHRKAEAVASVQVSRDQVGQSVQPFVSKGERMKAGDGLRDKTLWKLRSIPGGVEAIGNDHKNIDQAGIHCGLYPEAFDVCRRAAIGLLAIAPHIDSPEAWFDAQLRAAPGNGEAVVTALPGMQVEINKFPDSLILILRFRRQH